MTVPSRSRWTHRTIQPSMGWLLVFVPALSYFLATRLHSCGFRWGGSNSLGERITGSVLFNSSGACATLSAEVLYASQPCDQNPDVHPLKYGLHLQYQGRGMKGIVASTWRHDDGLGRGYLLFSQTHDKGRVWRWEVGGGPIAIGRTLHLEGSGCRSPRCVQPLGSGGIAIDFHHGSQSDHYSEGSLVVAEWGEGRIVRMEESTGARTPLLLKLPDICAESSFMPLHQPRSLLYTPYGDLLVADTAPHCGKAAIFRLAQAVHVPPLESLRHSREAHSWNQTAHSFPIDVLYHQNIRQIGGMAIDPTWLHIVTTILHQDGSVLLVRVPLLLDDDQETEPKVLMDLSQEMGISQPGPLAVSDKGHVFLATPKGIAILASTADSWKVLGFLTTPQPPTSLTLGEDNFLYVLSDDSLFRIRLRVRPVAVPTNLVSGKKL